MPMTINQHDPFAAALKVLHEKIDALHVHMNALHEKVDRIHAGVLDELPPVTLDGKNSPEDWSPSKGK